jgi:hypothetical protein
MAIQFTNWYNLIQLSRYREYGIAMINKKIIVAGTIILAFGLINAAKNRKPFSTVVEAGLVLILVTSIIDAFGEDASKLASSLAILAAAMVVLNQIGPFLQFIGASVAPPSAVTTEPLRPRS